MLPSRLSLFEFLENSRLGALQYAIQASQDSEWQNDFAVIGLLVVATQEVGHRPNEGRKVRFGHVWDASGVGVAKINVRILE